MRPVLVLLRVVLLTLIVGLPVAVAVPTALPRQEAAAPSAVPPVVRFSATLPPTGEPGGWPPNGAVLVTFALYAEKVGGEPLWSESQRVVVDAVGRYSVLLGRATPNGLPSEVFRDGRPRWVGVRVQGREELPRVPLTSVAYALKAGDADTIGGKPLSAFVLAGETTGVGEDGLTYINRETLHGALGSAFAPASSGTVNYIGMFTTPTDLGNSMIYQSGTNIGVNTLAPLASFHVAAPVAPAAFFDVYSNLLGALPAVNRAARGTPSLPAAVQAGDILGGLAVRGYGDTTFGPGVGQVMYRAAENFTDAARGTYLSMTTTPLGSGVWQERLRIDPAGNVGIGTPSPGQKLSVVGTIESLIGGFKFPDGTVQTTGGLSTGQNGAFGTDSLKANTTGAGNSAFGQSSLKANTTGAANTGLGYLSLGANTTGNSNTALGEESLAANVGASFNTAVGTKSLFKNTANDNTAVGYFSLYSNTSGTMNTAVGSNALAANTTATGNTAVGYVSLRNLADGNYNTAMGANTMAALTSGIFNSAFGYMSLYAASAASYNTGFGGQALSATTTAWLNTAIGYRSLARVTSGGMNTAAGAQSLHSVTTGVSNSAFGFNAMQGNATGGNNSAFGVDSLSAATGDANSGFGYQALNEVTTGVNNTAVGSGAGAGIVGGSNNTFLGYAARAVAGSSGLYNATAIGANAQVGQSNAIVLGSGGVSVGIGTSTPNAALQVVGDVRVGTSGTLGCVQRFDGTAIAGTCSSDARLKTDVRPFGSVLGRVARLQPVHFRWKASQFPSYHFGPGASSGLLAQDVEQVFPELVATDANGYKMVNYSELPLLAVAALGELNREVARLRADDERLRGENRLLKEQLATMSERLERLERKR